MDNVTTRDADRGGSDPASAEMRRQWIIDLAASTERRTNNCRMFNSTESFSILLQLFRKTSFHHLRRRLVGLMNTRHHEVLD